MPGGRVNRTVIGMTILVLLITISCVASASEPGTEPVRTAQAEEISLAPASLSQATHPQVPIAQSQSTAEPTMPTVTQPVPAAASAASVPESRDEKQKDRVLSQGELDLKLNSNPDVEQEPGGNPKDFFVSVQEDDGKKDTELYNGLMGRIEMWIRYFQTRGRDKFELYLTRSGKYEDMMRGILEKYGLPGDLIYLALIESGFSPKAYSVAKAAGPWQFIAGTGRRYGLKIDWWTDERRDYEKSTHAAASYLKDLYGMFDSWPLATAAYNAGEGKITKAVARYKSDDYVELSRYRYLKRETKDYVPKMIAALTIAKDPEKFGFGGVQYEAPLEFEKVTVPGGTDMDALGRVVGVPYETVREWNPELRRFCTPPNRETYELRLPKGFGEIAQDRMEEIRANARVTFVQHTVRKGETLKSLADRYETTEPVLQELNGLRKPKIGRSARLIVPVVGLSAEEAVPGKEISAAQVETAFKRLDTVSRRSGTVKVRRGDTLRKIAKRTGVSAAALASENGIEADGKLRAGTRLRLPGTRSCPSAGGKKELRHVVRRGDTLTKIARAHGVTRAQLAERNNLEEGEARPRGRVLIIPHES